MSLLRCPACAAERVAVRNAERLAAYASGPVGVAPERAVGPAGGQGQAAICTACGADTRVPFLPRADRPVYCRGCFDAWLGR